MGYIIVEGRGVGEIGLEKRKKEKYGVGCGVGYWWGVVVRLLVLGGKKE